MKANRKAAKATNSGLDLDHCDLEGLRLVRSAFAAIRAEANGGPVAAMCLLHQIAQERLEGLGDRSEAGSIRRMTAHYAWVRLSEALSTLVRAGADDAKLDAQERKLVATLESRRLRMARQDATLQDMLLQVTKGV